MVLDPIPQSLPVHFFGSRPQPPTSPPFRVFESRCNATWSETKSLELLDTKSLELLELLDKSKVARVVGQDQVASQPTKSLESLELLDKSKVARVVGLDQVASQATKSLELSNNSSDLRCDLIYWRTLLEDFLEWLSWKNTNYSLERIRRTLLKDFFERLSWKTSIRSSRWNERSLQNIVSFTGLFCKRDLWNYSTLWVELTLLKDLYSKLSLKRVVSAEYSLFYGSLLQKRPMKLLYSLSRVAMRPQLLKDFVFRFFFLSLFLEFVFRLCFYTLFLHFFSTLCR